MKEQNKYLTVTTFARLIGKPKSTVYYYLYNKIITAKKSGSTYLIPIEQKRVINLYLAMKHKTKEKKK